MTRGISILTCLVVAVTSVYCGCMPASAMAWLQTASRNRPRCCEHRGAKQPASPASNRSDPHGTPSCPHCGDSASNARIKDSGAQAVVSLPNAVLLFHVLPQQVLKFDLTAIESPYLADRASGPPASTLLRLHCALTV